MSDHVPRLSHEEQFSSPCPGRGIIKVGAVDVIVPIIPFDVLSVREGDGRDSYTMVILGSN